MWPKLSPLAASPSHPPSTVPAPHPSSAYKCWLWGYSLTGYNFHPITFLGSSPLYYRWASIPVVAGMEGARC